MTGTLTVDGNINDITPTEIGYPDGVTSSIQDQIDAAGGGGASIAIIGGEVTDEATNPTRPLTVLGGKYFFMNESTSYCHLPEYNTVDVGWWCELINSNNAYCYCQTFTRGTTTTDNSSDQEMYADKNSATPSTAHKYLPAGKTGYVVLFERTGGMESWLMMDLS